MIGGISVNKNSDSNQINSKIKPFIEKYLDSKYENRELVGIPDIDEIQKMAIDIKQQLLKRYPELKELLNSDNSDTDVQVAFYGCCGYLLWGLLLGSLYSRCGRNCRCRR